jgi:hypothetical protein
MGVGNLTAFGVSLAKRQQGKQGIVNEASKASLVRRDRASLAKQGEHQEYIDVLSLP